MPKNLLKSIVVNREIFLKKSAMFYIFTVTYSMNNDGEVTLDEAYQRYGPLACVVTSNQKFSSRFYGSTYFGHIGDEAHQKLALQNERLVASSLCGVALYHKVDCSAVRYAYIYFIRSYIHGCGMGGVVNDFTDLLEVFEVERKTTDSQIVKQNLSPSNLATHAPAVAMRRLFNNVITQNKKFLAESAHLLAYPFMINEICAFNAERGVSYHRIFAGSTRGKSGCSYSGEAILSQQETLAAYTPQGMADLSSRLHELTANPMFAVVSGRSCAIVF